MENDQNEREKAEIRRVLRPNWPLICVLVTVFVAWIFTAWQAYEAAGAIQPPY